MIASSHLILIIYETNRSNGNHFKYSVQMNTFEGGNYRYVVNTRKQLI